MRNQLLKLIISEKVKLPYRLSSFLFDKVIPTTKLKKKSMIMADKRHMFKAPSIAVIILTQQYVAKIA